MLTHVGMFEWVFWIEKGIILMGIPHPVGKETPGFSTSTHVHGLVQAGCIGHTAEIDPLPSQSPAM